MIVTLVKDAVESGAGVEPACLEVGVSVRTFERWEGGALKDMRRGPKKRPANALSAKERERVLEIANSPEFRDLSPHQIVPRLADRGVYIASESTFQRLFREARQNIRRERARAPKRRPIASHVAAGANQVWSWDITYLRSPVRGMYFYLYLVEDVFSRKIVAWAIHEAENSELAAALIEDACRNENVSPAQLVLHADNGAPMRGATLLATLERLGVAPSYSRASVSNDNPYSESLFRTLKYRPEYPSRPFVSIAEARTWVADFVHWYNHIHLHSSIRFVTPSQRHEGLDARLLAKRSSVYQKARQLHPERWSGKCRDWSPAGPVLLNPTHVTPMDTALRADDESAVA